MRDMPGIDELLRLIFSRIRLILACAAAGLLGAYIFAAYIATPLYISSMSLYISNASEGQSAGSLDINDLAASQKLAATCAVILRDDAILLQAAERLQEDYTAPQMDNWLSLKENACGIDIGGLRGAIKISAVGNTEILKVEAETPNPELSARICEIIAEIAPEAVTKVIGFGSVTLISPARIAAAPSSPDIFSCCVAGFAAGAILSAGAVVLARTLDNTVKDADGLVKRYDIPILCEIPDLAVYNTGGHPPL